MPATELCVIHPGALSASCWTRLASHLPSGTPVKVLELETINRYRADDPHLTVAELADRLRGRLGTSRTPRVLVGWGVGGAVADALAVPSRRVVVLDGAAPGTPPPDPQRAFAMLEAAKAGRPSFEQHAARLERDHRLIAGHRPSGNPLTVVRASESLHGDGPALGWDRFGPVERLGSAGDHYSMLTDRGALAHLAMLLRRWLSP
jgi:thioesterase domain-containing protein